VIAPDAVPHRPCSACPRTGTTGSGVRSAMPRHPQRQPPWPAGTCAWPARWGVAPADSPTAGSPRGARSRPAPCRKPQKTTDPDQQPSPYQEAAVDLHALRGCVVAHQLHSSRRRRTAAQKAPSPADTVDRPAQSSIAPFPWPMFSASGLRAAACSSDSRMRVKVMLEQRVVGVVSLDAAGSRIRVPKFWLRGTWGHVWGMKQGTQGDNSGIERSVVICV
jgi:hypothetical protein